MLQRSRLRRLRVEDAAAALGFDRRIEMSVDKELLEILACPVTKTPLELSEDGNFLIARESRLVYKIEDGIPIMLEDEAIPLDEWEKGQGKGQ